MIRDGYISIYGVTTEDYVEGDPAPCPKCGMNSAQVIRALEFEPQGFRLGCTHCGYETPEELTVFSYDSAEGIKEALEVWNRVCFQAFLEEEAAKMTNLIEEFNAQHPDGVDDVPEEEKLSNYSHLQR